MALLKHSRKIIALCQPISVFHFFSGVLRSFAESSWSRSTSGIELKVHVFLTKNSHLCAFHLPWNPKENYHFPTARLRENELGKHSQRVQIFGWPKNLHEWWIFLKNFQGSQGREWHLFHNDVFPNSCEENEWGKQSLEWGKYCQNDTKYIF